jgi:hypothetical protein
MNSRVRFEDLETREQLEVTLVYPRDADVDDRRTSVLAPVGGALLGLAVGESITWPLPGGKDRHLRVIGVTYQPEAAGDARVVVERLRDRLASEKGIAGLATVTYALRPAPAGPRAALPGRFVRVLPALFECAQPVP